MFARRYLPSIPSILALEAVARLGTASAAAAELNLTQGAISRQLQVLEGQMGAALLLRDRSRLRLTPAGEDFVAEARRALSVLSAASLKLRANPLGGTLNLAILPAFGMHWLAPRLAGFSRAHPEVTINLSTRLRPFDFRDQAFDAAIHYGREDWPEAAHMKLMDESLQAVAAPGLSPPLASAADLRDLPLLQIEGRPGDWQRWLSGHGQDGPRPPAMLFDQWATLIQAAIHGLGAALAPTFLIERDLAEGRLVPLFGRPVAASGAYHLVWDARLPPRAPLVSFRNWMAAEIGLPPAAPL